MIKTLIERVSTGKSPSPSEGGGSALPPEVGAAGLLLAIAKRDGIYTEIETDLVCSALMKLFHVPRATADDHLHKAEKAERKGMTINQKALAARALPLENKEMLITRLWAIMDGDEKKTPDQAEMMRVIADVIGLSHERVKVLRLPSVKETN